MLFKYGLIYVAVGFVFSLIHLIAKLVTRRSITVGDLYVGLAFFLFWPMGMISSIVFSCVWLYSKVKSLFTNNKEVISI